MRTVITPERIRPAWAACRRYLDDDPSLLWMGFAAGFGQPGGGGRDDLGVKKMGENLMKFGLSLI